MTSDVRFNGSDIHFDPRGKISFTYYFNPTANDRNLGFDPGKNFFTDLEWRRCIYRDRGSHAVAEIAPTR